MNLTAISAIQAMVAPVVLITAAALLSGALGDYRPAAPTLRPAYLWALLRP